MRSRSGRRESPAVGGVGLEGGTTLSFSSERKVFVEMPGCFLNQ